MLIRFKNSSLQGVGSVRPGAKHIEHTEHIQLHLGTLNNAEINWNPT